MLSYKSRSHASVHVEHVAGALGQHSAHENKDCHGDVLRKDRLMKQGAFRIIFGQFLHGDAIGFGTAFGPAAGPDIAALDDGVRVHDVYPDVVAAQLGGHQAAHVQLRCFGRAVADIVGTAYQGVLADDIHDVAAHALPFHHFDAGL